MVLYPNHVTVAVTELAPAKEFFALLGFEETETKFISGPVMEQYLGVPGIDAEHVTMVLDGCAPHFDIQLLKYKNPKPTPNEHVRDLTTLGFNHLCFAVEDLDAALAALTAAGVKTRNGAMEFRDYKMAFIWGPEGITIELVEKLN